MIHSGRSGFRKSVAVGDLGVSMMFVIAMPSFHTSTGHGHMPGHWHWWSLLYCVVCGVSLPPSFTAGRLAGRSFSLPWTLTPRVFFRAQIPGRNSLPHTHCVHSTTSFCSFVFVTFIASERANNEHGHKLVARGFWGDD